MKLGVILLNFGEPAEPTMEAVVPFLERIFSLNAPLMGTANPTEEEIRARSRMLAEQRAPGLIAEYEEIGGSPLQRQAEDQSEALQSELRSRGYDVTVRLGMQFTTPSIADAVKSARGDGVDFLVPLAVYPLCGPSTNVAALTEVDRQLTAQGWSVETRQVSGWHRHPAYLEVRARAITDLMAANGLSFSDPRTRLVFSAHGTPIKYLDEGSRYDRYVREFCASLARQVEAPGYELGYQNHTNRPGVRWTEPNIEDVVTSVDADTLVVDAVSFMHEQSETLAELDGELREKAEERGLHFYRVPIPHVDAGFISLLADLVEASIPERGSAAPIQLFPCRCKPTEGTFCTNGGSL